MKVILCIHVKLHKHLYKAKFAREWTNPRGNSTFNSIAIGFDNFHACEIRANDRYSRNAVQILTADFQIYWIVYVRLAEWQSKLVQHSLNFGHKAYFCKNIEIYLIRDHQYLSILV